MRLLIICFTFPPHDGIGGRRWSKFTKYLIRSGIDCFVLAAKKSGKRNSHWVKDIEGFVNKIEYVKPPYPSPLTVNPFSLIDKIQYKIALTYAKYKYKKRNYYDHSIGFGNKLKKIIVAKIKEGYNNILVTVGPFSMSAEIIELKKEHPEVNFIVDFRDPWANNMTSFGYSEMNYQTQLNEQKMESLVISNFDHVISVSEEMNDYFKDKVGFVPEGKFICLPNGYDSEDFEDSYVHLIEQDKIVISFCGTLYEKSKHRFLDLIEILDNLKSNNPVLYQKLQVDFMGYVPAWFHDNIANHKIIKYRGLLAQEESLLNLKKSDFILLFLTDDLSFSRSTKFYEALYLRKPLMVFSSDGATGNFVECNALGFTFNGVGNNEKFKEVISSRIKNQLIFNNHFDISRYEVKELAKQIAEILK